jgi:hypothetical protein
MPSERSGKLKRAEWNSELLSVGFFDAVGAFLRFIELREWIRERSLHSSFYILSISLISSIFSHSSLTHVMKNSVLNDYIPSLLPWARAENLLNWNLQTLDIEFIVFCAVSDLSVFPRPCHRFEKVSFMFFWIGQTGPNSDKVSLFLKIFRVSSHSLRSLFRASRAWKQISNHTIGHTATLLSIRLIKT